MYIHKNINKSCLGIVMFTVVIHLASFAQQTPPTAYPVGTPVNHVRTWDITAPVTTESSIADLPLKAARQTTQYIDGLGRTLQTVVKQGSLMTAENTPKDLVSPVLYDEYGREQLKYLPFAANDVDNNNVPLNDGTFKFNPFQQLDFFYSDANDKSPIKGQGETEYYSKTDFEPSPLSRPLATYAPGNSWVGNNKGTSLQYLFNTKTGDDVKIISVNGYDDYEISGKYDDGQLYKTITTDEEGHKVIEYKDKDGKVILKKVQAAGDSLLGSSYNGWLCTYYVYDDLNLLRLVLPPKAVKKQSGNNWAQTHIGQETLDNLCFKYEYDNRHRMILKKVPGAAEVLMVYDQWDRLVLTQDGNLRTVNDWIYTKYDAFNRPVYTGVYNFKDPLAQLRNDAQAAPGRFEHLKEEGPSFEYTYNNSFPDVSDKPRLLTVTFYDNYGFAANLAPEFQQMNSTGVYNFFSTATGNAYPYAQPLIQSPATKGLVTGKFVYQLTTGEFNITALFYDNKGRVIQTVADNISKAIDITTTQYNFSGMPLKILQQHGKSLNGDKQHEINTYTTMQYDDLWRLLTVQKWVEQFKSNGVYAESPVKTIVQNEYNQLGQLQSKTLGLNDKTDDFIETLKYDYNIRGWLTGINKKYIDDNTWDTEKDHYFGMELAYDKPAPIDNSITYAHPQLNGNIAGTMWKSKGDEKIRKYDYNYDNVNRLLSADFTQKGESGGNIVWDNSAADFTVKMGNGTDYTTAYDENGNILRMQQWGLKLTGSYKIDDLIYTYEDNSNRLKNVVDKENVLNTNLGDFHTSANHPKLNVKQEYVLHPSGVDLSTITDYTYDNNGNLTLDENKDIENITYNILNLPEQITIDGGTSYITYQYDATGNKLSKTTHDEKTPGKTITTITKYIAGFVYESKTTEPADTTAPDYIDKLLFTGHEEGRIRYNGVTEAEENQGKRATFAFDYFIKDHLGNIRMVLTDEGKEDKYPAATLETANIANERTFYTIPDGATTHKAEIPVYPQNDNTTEPNDFIQKLDGNGTKVGSSITLKVMAGDHFNISVSSWYKKIISNDPVQDPLNNLVAALTTGIVGASAGAGHAVTAAQLEEANILPQNIQAFLTRQNDEALPDDRPRAYVNWILFDEQFKYIASSSGAEQVPEETVFGSKVHKHILNDLPIYKNGYLYIYVSNVSPNYPVYFDNLQVTHYRGVIFEETHYYPFGLVQAGISSKAAGITPNRRKFNAGSELQSEEFIDGSGLELYSTQFRSLDPQLGRWWSVDPKPDYSESPYVSMNNNPVLKNDPLGDTAIFYSYGGRELYRMNDGKKRITPTIISEKNQEGFMNAVAGGEASIKELKGFGITYDTKSFSKFYSTNKNKFQATTAAGVSITAADKVTVNGKTVDKNSLKAEATGNTVLQNGVVTVGNNPAKSANSMTGSVQDAGKEANRTGSIHLHPTATNLTVGISSWGQQTSIPITGGRPSESDYNEHTRAFQTGDAQNGVRSVMVDDKNIYLYNSAASQTIVIPRL